MHLAVGSVISVVQPMNTYLGTLVSGYMVNHWLSISVLLCLVQYVTIVETLVSQGQEQGGSLQSLSPTDAMRTWVKATHARLSEIITVLHNI